MTNEEAIPILRQIAGSYGDVKKYYDAMDMAIDALENNDKLTEDLQNIGVYANIILHNCLEMYKKKKAEVEALKQTQWIPCSERLPSKEERKEWIDNNLDGIGYLYPCLVTRYSSFNPDRTKNNPYVAKHYFDGEDFLNAGEEVCSEYIIAWMPLPEPWEGDK